MADRESYEYKIITVFGVVQGVGFRPFVAARANELKLDGWVRNLGGYVEIGVAGMASGIDALLAILENPDLPGAVVLELESTDTAPFDFFGFSILESEVGAPRSAVIPADLPMCPICEEELFEPGNRRYLHPFISCASCGPRYSIMKRLPYDRDTTSMDAFPMCPQCLAEYTNEHGRRHHAQTVSCHDCGPQLIYRKDGAEYHRDEAMKMAIRDVQHGVVAIKGVGGYHYACSPYNAGAVRRMRALKGRDSKPFAVMFPKLAHIKRVCDLTPADEELLLSAARPIVLADINAQYDFTPEVGCGSLQCGCFLPYTALHVLMLRQTGPLIMTSANRSGDLVIFEDSEMLSISDENIEGVLYNTREIIQREDDSVVRSADGSIQMIRRSRGFAPLPVRMSRPTLGTIIATGGDLKASLAIYKERNCFLGPFIGDLEDERNYEYMLRHMESLCAILRATPDRAACDMHPGYHSARAAKSLGLPVTEVQHHHAHICSVIAEHRLSGPVIGVAMDGTGYGADGAVWGGEFLVCYGKDYTRAAHLRYVDMLGGDSSMKDSLKTADCFMLAAGLQASADDQRFATVKAAVENKINVIKSSSMGRLFDAVSAMLGFSTYNGYEGESAILLERAAVTLSRSGRPFAPLEFEYGSDNSAIIVDWRLLLEQISRARGDDPYGAALGFHHAVADMITAVCRKLSVIHGTKVCALSGGVFQNALLLGLSLAKLRDAGFEVYINRQTPANDGCIALGQAYAASLS